ncbi:nitrile hydratase subunit alpha [Leptolyngbya sp. NK1-12]|uniref:nitrile hydratase n=1 Tax=Leptolyngbya sp. NK1-12 TaxID=2547451 RepID=A0AA97AL09_9CYAN|nr:nitrile hydratase subunit alpha [Leptolyngbya sp. NK1-12]WNZ24137.1 nitrile hydratase subunit alpha [Leptolyngbya sp. NK1-12]
MSNDHDHDHGHYWSEPSENDARVRALESLLIEKGFLTSDAVDAVVSTFEQDIGPMNGAKVVAKAWVDPAFKQFLLQDATAALATMGYTGLQGEHMVAVENTPTVHHVIVCTLCSCYPWPLLGIPPNWYKQPQYRARVVLEPRKVLQEFGLELDDSVEVKVWDTSAEIRYMVVPERPVGTEHMSEAELAQLVTRDAIIGVAKVKSPTLA